MIVGVRLHVEVTDGVPEVCFRFYIFNTFWSLLVLCYYICYVCLWPRASVCGIVLINAAGFPYHPSVTTIIIPTSLRSFVSRKKNIVRVISQLCLRYFLRFRTLLALYCRVSVIFWIFFPFIENQNCRTDWCINSCHRVCQYHSRLKKGYFILRQSF